MDKIFEALASTPRRKILAYLSEVDLTAGEIAARFEMSKPAVSKHLRVLEQAGLISRRHDAQRRPRRLEAAALADASAWLDDFRRLWEARFERLDGILESLQEPKKAPPRRRRGETR